MKNKTAKLFFLFIVFFIIFFSTDLIGILFAPAGYDYYLGDPDTNVYFTYMDQARDGRFFMCNQYAADDHKCRLFFPHWYIAGRMGGFFKMSNLMAFYLIKLIFGFLFFIILYYFCVKFFKQHSFWVFLMAIFSGGVYFEYLHANVFLSVLRNPQNMLVLFLYLIIIWIIVNIQEKESAAIMFIALGCVNWFLVMIHPYQTFLLILIYGIFILINSFVSLKNFYESLKISLISLSGACLGLVYYFLLFTGSPAYSGWFVNNELPIYGFKSVIFGFGLLLPFSLIGSYLILKNIKYNKIWFIIVSLAIGGWVSVFLPLYINNKLFLGWYFGLFLTSAYLIIHIINNRLFGRCRTAILTLIVILLISGNMGFYIKRFFNLFILQYPNYLPSKFFLSAYWLKENSSINDSILTIDKWDTFYISQAGLKSFVGSNQVFELQKKIELSRWFYKNNDQDQEKRDMLNNYGLDFVLFSAFEKEKGSYDPSTKEYLEKVYDDGWAQIYKVIPQA